VLNGRFFKLEMRSVPRISRNRGITSSSACCQEPSGAGRRFLRAPTAKDSGVLPGFPALNADRAIAFPAGGTLIPIPLPPPPYPAVIRLHSTTFLPPDPRLFLRFLVAEFTGLGRSSALTVVDQACPVFHSAPAQSAVPEDADRPAVMQKRRPKFKARHAAIQRSNRKRLGKLMKEFGSPLAGCLWRWLVQIADACSRFAPAWVPPLRCALTP